MSTKINYEVMVGETKNIVGTLKEVSALLGEKVTKAKINNGEYKGIVTELLEDEPVDNIEEGVARVYNEDGEYDGIKLVNPLEGKEDTDMNINNTNTEELANDIVTDEEDIEETATDEEDIEDVDNEDSEDEDTNEDDKDDSPSMTDLMKRMKELNAKKKAENPNSTGTGKSKRTKTMEFTGEYPEVGAFTEKKQLQKFYKQLTDEQLNDWIELEGLTYKESDNEPINRMRKCMAILDLHFPKENTGSSKKKSKYASFTTEQLLELALDNNVEVKEAKGNDERILRMYTIMALRNAGVIE